MEEIYKDHAIILEKIPDYFYPALLGELISINGTWIIGYAHEYGDLFSSAGGWYCALRQTCEKLNLNWIIDYHRGLEWYDSDIFDGELESRCCKLIVTYDGATDSIYESEDVRNSHKRYYKALSNKFNSK